MFRTSKFRLVVTTFLPPSPRILPPLPVFCSAVHVQQIGTQVKIKRMFLLVPVNLNTSGAEVSVTITAALLRPW